MSSPVMFRSWLDTRSRSCVVIALNTHLGHLSSPWTLQREWRKQAASPIHHFVCIFFPMWPCLNKGLQICASPCASTLVDLSPCLMLPGRDRYQVLKYYCCSPAGGCWTPLCWRPGDKRKHKGRVLLWI